MVSNIRKKAMNKTYCFHKTENKFPLAGMKDLFKNTFSFDGI